MIYTEQNDPRLVLTKPQFNNSLNIKFPLKNVIISQVQQECRKIKSWKDQRSWALSFHRYGCWKRYRFEKLWE